MPFLTNKEFVFFFNWEILVKKYVDSYLESSWKHVVNSIIDDDFGLSIKREWEHLRQQQLRIEEEISNIQKEAVPLVEKPPPPYTPPALGTIHILRKHFCIAKNLIWLPNYSQELGFFFVKTKEFLYQQYILTKFWCCSQSYISQVL